MRRLTLILSDLYLPAEASIDVIPQAAVLPDFDWLLSSARAPAAVDDWRHSIAADLGLMNAARQSLASLASQKILPADVAAHAWLATPVRLEARLDHVRLMDRGLMRLPKQERLSASEEFARSFGSDYALHDAGVRGFLLAGLKPARVASADPARLLDADIAAAIPTGIDARELRRLGAEIDMWLHNSSLNASRERSGTPRISSLWLWGGGTEYASASAKVEPCAPSSSVALYGEDPVLAGIARALTQRALMPAPAGFSELPRDADRAVVELAPMSGAADCALPQLALRWFAPMRAAIRSGELTRVDIIANDRCFCLAGRSHWRIWRRRRSWLELLHGRAQSVKA